MEHLLLYSKKIPVDIPAGFTLFKSHEKYSTFWLRPDGPGAEVTLIAYGFGAVKAVEAISEIISKNDQDIVTFTPLLARGQAFTLGIGGDLHCRRPSISFQGSFDARALKGLHVAKTLQALKIKIQNLKNPDKLKKFVE